MIESLLLGQRYGRYRSHPLGTLWHIAGWGVCGCVWWGGQLRVSCILEPHVLIPGGHGDGTLRIWLRPLDEVCGSDETEALEDRS